MKNNTFNKLKNKIMLKREMMIWWFRKPDEYWLEMVKFLIVLLFAILTFSTSYYITHNILF